MDKQAVVRQSGLIRSPRKETYCFEVKNTRKTQAIT